jgi:phenylpropionate dioxygenase-like ring-hydroxylating dioxygenase large terminal subunit
MTQQLAPDSASTKGASESPFDFFQHWYPLSPLEDLDPNRPTAVTLLGQRLVIWKPPTSSQFCVFRDRCPHRLAPLSEGRIDKETGTLMCSYHGWQFDTEGTCTRIPQADRPQILSEQRDTFCVISFPVRQANDLLWVWPDAASAAIAETQPLPLSPQLDAERGFVWSSMVRDLEYDWQTLIENVADPSHVPFAHHGVQGDRNTAQPLPIKIATSTPELIVAESKGRLSSTITFQPPCHLEYSIQFGDSGKQVGLVTYCIPVAPGKSRIVAQFPRNFARNLQKITPRWLEHVKTRNLVLDGDMVLLHYQERELQQNEAARSWQEAYKLPATADRLVIEFRRWFDKYCQGQLPWHRVGLNPDLEPLVTDKRVVLDRYGQHTVHCSSCRGALQSIRRLQAFLLGLFAVSIAIAAVLPDAERFRLGVPLATAALTSLAVYAFLKNWLVPKFYFVDYVHADK